MTEPDARPAPDLPQTVLVTGAGGFLGRALSSRLLDLGVTVRGVDRAGALVPPGVDLTVGDTRRPEEWATALGGVDAVVHTAALVSNVAPLRDAWDVNVRGTSNTLHAAREAGVRRFVHLSSIAAYGFDFPDQVTETYPVSVNGHSYTDTKVNGEAVVLAAHGEGGIETVVLRPGDVYGPESRPWVVLPLEIIQAGQALLPRGGAGVFSPVYIDNMIDGMVLALASPVAAGRTYNITDGVAVTCREYFQRLADMTRGKIRGLPARPAYVLASSLGSLQRLVGRESELCAASMKMLDRRGTYSIDKARRELGYRPLIDLDEGMRRTRQWADSAGLL